MLEPGRGYTDATWHPARLPIASDSWGVAEADGGRFEVRLQAALAARTSWQFVARMRRIRCAIRGNRPAREIDIVEATDDLTAPLRRQ